MGRKAAEVERENAAIQQQLYRRIRKEKEEAEAVRRKAERDEIVNSVAASELSQLRPFGRQSMRQSIRQARSGSSNQEEEEEEEEEEDEEDNKQLQAFVAAWKRQQKKELSTMQ